MGDRRLNITLPDEAAEAIAARVASGHYASEDEAILAAIRALLREEDEHRLDVIRRRMERSLEDPRPNLRSDEVRSHLDALYIRHKG
ncbi:ribbon-helix-helix protein, CopG family [Rhizobium deserti]|uniref:Ribbon-helix-helix protein, CopG family n=1 Tax=Rhizobium deserti TaxID=2547961 RepID=A0A4R5UJA9_9HYPH|nr:ribbon-helix-helix protein, CopG family [Rhizobium deserti]TDK36938.1 ribbon-helix-helix protein, CopG family [Rhizobium deserti]